MTYTAHGCVPILPQCVLYRDLACVIKEWLTRPSVFKRDTWPLNETLSLNKTRPRNKTQPLNDTHTLYEQISVQS